MAETEFHAADAPPSRLPRWRVALEISLVFVVFFLHGAWPTPDVNETGYLCKAQHFWNPHAFEHDFFCSTGDAHAVYYWAFGWVTNLGLPLDTVAWIGRVVTWILLAIAWRGLSYSLIPRPWLAVISAQLFVMLTEQAHMAGEWIVGGVEAKGFAWAFVLWALQALVLGRWNLACILLGIATSLHVLVGGWGAICLALVWFFPPGRRPALPLAGAIVGTVLAIPGLYFAGTLNVGAEASTVAEANRIQVFERLPHHLLPTGFQTGYVPRHLLLWALFAVLCLMTPAAEGNRFFRRFVAAAMGLAVVGFVLGLLASVAQLLAASVLRFYWFRMTDILAPAGVAVVALEFLSQQRATKKRYVCWMYAALITVSVFDFWTQALHFAWRPPAWTPVTSRADKFMVDADWRDVCRWANEHTPPGTIFITPKSSNSFKWYSGRDEAATWKDMPQDANSVLEWHRRLDDLYDFHGLRDLSAKYGAQYAIVDQDNLLWLDRQPIFDGKQPVYANGAYRIYRLESAAK
jgi:hypothetical protein